MRVVVTGGGTGGHIMPALAIAEAIKRRDPQAETLFIGGSSGMETEIIPKYGVPFQAVTSRKLRKVVSPSTVGVMLALLKGYREAQTYIRAFRADAVVGTGGYAAGATALAAARMGLPTLIHEGNAIAGRTNLFLARWVRKVGVTFAETISAFPAGKGVHIGLPLRSGIVLPASVTAEQARRGFRGIAEEPFTVLVIGGSQGARAINRLVLEAIGPLLGEGVQVLHQTGPRNYEEVEMLAKEKGVLASGGYLPLAFLDEKQMPLAFRAADLIVCRGGISTLSEALVNSLPLVVIPLPTAYADHQTANAKALERVGAALHCAESGLTATGLVETVLSLRHDEGKRHQMQAASLQAGKPEAADTMAQLIQKEAGL